MIWLSGQNLPMSQNRIQHDLTLIKEYFIVNLKLCVMKKKLFLKFPFLATRSQNKDISHGISVPGPAHGEMYNCGHI